jgi:hypothetical protein
MLNLLFRAPRVKPATARRSFSSDVTSGLVLQLYFMAFSVVGLRGDVLMTAPPEGSAENEGEIESGLEKDSGDQIADFRHGRHEISQ